MLLSILHSCLIQYSTEDEVSISLEKNSTTTPLFECGALPRRHRAAAHIWKKTYIHLVYLHGKVKVLYTTSLPHSMMPLKPFLPTLPYTSVPVFTLVFLLGLLHFEGQGSNTHQQHEQQRLLCKQRLTNIAEQL